MLYPPLIDGAEHESDVSFENFFVARGRLKKFKNKSERFRPLQAAFLGRFLQSERLFDFDLKN